MAETAPRRCDAVSVTQFLRHVSLDSFDRRHFFGVLHGILAVYVPRLFALGNLRSQPNDTMKRPAIAAGRATTFALALAAGASHQSLPVASAVQQQPPSHHAAAAAASSASSTWKQFEATSPASVGRHHHHRRRYGRMRVEEEEGGDVSRNQNGLAGAVGGLWDTLRRRPRGEVEDDEQKQTKKEEDGDDNNVEKEVPREATDQTEDEDSPKMDEPNKDASDKDKDGENAEDTEEASDGTVSAMPPTQPQPQQPQSPGSQRPPMYIVRPRPPAGLQNHPSNSPLGGLLIPSGVGIGGIGSSGVDPSSSSSQSVQSALLSALTKVLVATLLTPGGLRNNPLLQWLLPRRSRERPYLPDPVQRYTFERLNDRYERDGAALERALLETAPAADRVGHFWRRRRRWQQLQQSHKSSRRVVNSKKKKALMDGDKNTNNKEKKSEIMDAATDKQTHQQQLPQRQEGEHRTVIVLDFCTDPNSPSARHLPTPGHTHAPAEGHAAPHDPVELLRDQISFVLEQYRDPTIRSLLGRQVEVVLRVESGGGGVQDFGVAADAVRRIRDAAADAAAAAAAGSTSSSSSTDASAPGSLSSIANGTGNESLAVAAETPKKGEAALTEENDIILTVCVDRIAASGGYMVAAQASRGRLFAAPFALVGSIGVYTERVNIHDALTRLGVRGLVLKAGKSKAPIGTRSGR